MKKLLMLFVICVAFSTSSYAYITQSNWRWRNNDGSETTATWRAAQNKPITISTTDSIIRLRVALDNSNAEVHNINTNLQYATAPDGPWRYVTNYKGGNAFIFSSTNAYISDLAATTQQLKNDIHDFDGGKLLVKTNMLDEQFQPNTSKEYEYSLQPTDNIEPRTTYYFRVPSSGDYNVVLPSLTTTSTIKNQSKTFNQRQL